MHASEIDCNMEKVPEEIIDDDYLDSEKKLRHGSPFYRYFNEIYIAEKAKISIVNSRHEELEKIENLFYCPQFIEYVLEHIMPFFPLWSALIMSDFCVIQML